MDEGGPMLGVGFAIDASGSHEELLRLQATMDTVQGRIFSDAAKIEKATGGMINIAGVTTQVRTFGNAATRELRDVARATAQAEKSGELLVRQLERQGATFGKSRSELRGMKVETAALAAEQAGLTELAERLINREIALQAQEAGAAERAALSRIAAAERASQAEVASLRAANAQLAERARLEAALERNTGVGRVRAVDSGASYSALAARAAEQEQQASLAAAAAAKRLADEHKVLAAAVRGSHAAQLADAEAAEKLRLATDPLYAATKRLNQEIAESTRLYHAGATAPAEYARQQQVLQGRVQQAVAAHREMDQTIKRGSNTLTQLSFQLNDVATMAASGAPAFQIFATQAGQIFQVAQMAEGGLKGFAAEVGSAALRFAPLAIALGGAVVGFALFQRTVSAGVDTKAMVAGLGLTRAEIEKLKNTSVSSGDVIKATFQVMAERVGIHLGGLGKAWSSILDWMTDIGRKAMAGLYANTVGTFQAMVEAAKALGSGKGISGAIAAASQTYMNAYETANKELSRFGRDVQKQVAQNKLQDLRAQAAAIKADRTPKKDTRSENLARETAATEALIAGLYELARAYGVSDAAAMRAEVTARAREQGIKKQADLNAYVSQQLRKAVAEQAVAGAKSAADLAYQARAQDFVNAAVQAGTVTVENASEALNDLMQRRSLAAAKNLAAANKDVEGYKAAEDAMKSLEDAQIALHIAQKKANDLALENQINRSTAAIRIEADMVERYGAARLAALKGLNGRALEDQLAAINLEQQKSAILLRAQADAAALMAQGLDKAAAATLAQAQEQIRLADSSAAYDRNAEAIARNNDELRDMIGLLGNLGGIGSGLGALLGVVSGNTASIRGPLGDLLNMGMAGKDQAGKPIASTIGDELTKVFGKDGAFGQTLKSHLEGAGAGMIAADAIFGKQSTIQKLGSAIGGTAGKSLGTAIAGPVGGAIGSIAGGLLGSAIGGLFKSVKWGRTDLSAEGVSAATGNSASSQKAALTAGNSIFGSLKDLATQLGGAIGDFGNISVGVRHGDYRVNAGGTSLKVKKGAIDFNDDADAAVAYAIKLAIERGAITGIRQSTNNLLKAGDDLQASLQKALSFENVFADLKSRTDPIGAALDSLDKEFTQLRAIFKEAGATADEYAQLEQLLTLKRQEALAKESDAIEDVRSRIAEAQGDDATVKQIERARELKEAMTDAVRAELNRLYAVEDAVAAQEKLAEVQREQTAAAEELRDAWSALGNDLMEEVRRIRGLTDPATSGGFAKIMAEFNAATALARGGDKEAAGRLVELSQSLIEAAGLSATSRQELERVKAQTAASLEATYGLIGAITGAAPSASPASTVAAAATTVQATSTPAAANDDVAAAVRALQAEVAGMRSDNNAGHSANASNTGAIKRHWDNVTAASAGGAVSVAGAA